MHVLRFVTVRGVSPAVSWRGMTRDPPFDRSGPLAARQNCDESVSRPKLRLDVNGWILLYLCRELANLNHPSSWQFEKKTRCSKSTWSALQVVLEARCGQDSHKLVYLQLNLTKIVFVMTSGHLNLWNLADI